MSVPVGTPSRAAAGSASSTRLGATAASNALVLVVSFALSGLLLAATGADIAAATQAIVEGSVGSPEAIRQTLLQATPILIAGLGVSFALRAGLVNIGADGQLYMGALFAAAVVAARPQLPWPLGPTVLLAAGMVGGLLWGALPGWMRARLGMNEVITTLLLNFVAFWIVSYAVHGPLRDPLGGGYPWTPEVPPDGRLPILRLGGLLVPSGILVGVMLAAVVAVVYGRTLLGLELRLLGSNAAAALWGGVRVPRRILEGLAISGALAGVAGAAELAGNQHRLSDFFSPGFGYTAIVVALVGRATASGTVAASLLFGSLTAGAGSMERIAHVPASTALLVQGIVVAILAGSWSPVAQAFIAGVRHRVRQQLGERVPWTN